MTLSFKCVLYFEYVIDFSNQGSLLAGKTGQPYCLYCSRATLISMEEDTSLVWRKTLYLGSLNSNDLPRHFISMEEPKVITIYDVIDSTVMHVNDFPRPNSTLTRPLCILMIFLDLTRQ